MPLITVLCGGFGAARFLSGLRRIGDLDVTCVVNTADDLVYEGMSVSPDLDTVSYALAGCFDEERGWGVIGDTFRNAEALRRYGSGWFGIGDADLATHLTRSSLLARGATLTEATAAVSAALGTPARVLPMSDDPVRTVIVTSEGRLPFQEYLVKHRARPPVVAVDHDGLDAAQTAPGVVEAVADADLLVIAPSNPVASIGPILALPGVAEAAAGRRHRTVAVTPVVSGQAPVTGPERSRAVVRGAFMAARGLDHQATDVARAYSGAAGRFVLDRRDAAQTAAIEALGFEVMLADTLAPARERPGLAAAVVQFGLN